jgi:hypothetical protein
MFPRLAAAVLAAVATGPLAAADLRETEPFAFFSPKASLKPTGLPADADRLGNLPLRPNVEQQAYVFAYNPTAKAVTVTVSLAHGQPAGDAAAVEAGAELARTAAPVEIPANGVVRVALAGKPAAVPPAPPAAGQPPAPAAPAGAKLPAGARLVLRTAVVRADARDPLAAPAAGAVPNDNTYTLDVSAAALDLGDRIGLPDNPRNTLAVVVTAPPQARLTGRPYRVTLDLRPDLNPGLDVSGVTGTFEAEVEAGGKATLYAAGVQFDAAKQQAGTTRREAVVCVGVDGYDRAAVIRTGFAGKADQATWEPGVRLSFARGVPGPVCRVTVEAAGRPADVGGRTELLIDRTGGGPPREVLRSFPTARREEVYVGTGPDDAVVVTPVLGDWVVDFPTAAVIGTRSFGVRAAGADGRTATLLLDRTPPTDVALARPTPADLVTGRTLTLSAVGRDPESDVAAVYFYTGPPPAADGKPAPGGRVVKGVKVTSAAGPPTWTAPLQLPEARGELTVGVLFVNEVGLATAADERTVYVRDPEAEKAKRTTGSIEGVVVQGDRPQPGLPVELRLAGMTAVYKATTTDAAGRFRFEDLPPGGYVVSSVKRADANAAGRTPVSVEASETPAKAEVKVLR